MRTRIIASFLLLIGLWGCKTPGNSELRNDLAAAPPGPACPLDNSWAGRMGMRLADGGGGATVECVSEGEGLHHIGLRPGDTIVGLNNGAQVASAAAFEQAATQLAQLTGDDRVRRWEFSVMRGGQQVTVAPKEDYPACGLFDFADCGPLAQ